MLQQPWPFERVDVDFRIRGAARIYWSLAPAFRATSPYVTQLQASLVGTNSATDWVDVGAPVTDAYYADDATQRDFGMRINTHYRLRLQTPAGVFLSAPAKGCGRLTPQEFRTANEILRKFQLQNRLHGGITGALLKRRRHGLRCHRCVDKLSDTVTDGNCPVCRGTGWLVGYYPPEFVGCWRMQPESVTEKRNGDTVNATRDDARQAIAPAFPQLAKEDVWVDVLTDQRYCITKLQHTAEIRGVPILTAVEMSLIPYTDSVYKLEISGEPASRETEQLPSSGCGSVVVDHDYGGADRLRYITPDGCGIPGACVLAFTKTNYDLGLRSMAHATAASTTTGAGRWAYALKLDPGQYVLVYTGAAGCADTTYELTVS